MTFYDFLICHFKKRKKSCFLKSETNEKYVFSNTGFGRHLVAYMVPWSHPSPGPNGILIDSAVLQGSIVCPTDKLTGKHTDRETCHICSNSQQNDNDDDDDDDGFSFLITKPRDWLGRTSDLFSVRTEWDIT